MNIDLLIRMANQISSFFTTESPPGKAPADVATHLRRYWDPRMREQIITYYEQRQGAGLDDNARDAVGLLAADAKKASPA
ncbi:MAG TPA: formate dehydrogenase subunit delta [Steroidobacteraceae bacterium]|jgi:formate dehydrogenase subunit delta